MGDRCAVKIRCRADDAGLLAEALGADPKSFKDNDDGTSFFEAEEANYAMQTDRENAAAQGFAFYGTHGNGYEYNDGAFAAEGGHMVDIVCDIEGNPVARVERVAGGVVAFNAEDLHTLGEYYRVLDRAKAYIGGFDE